MSQVETRLVGHLLQAGDRWLTALDLSQQVMGRDDPNGEILVRQYIFRLRKRIERDGFRIEHVRTRGYRIVSVPHASGGLLEQGLERVAPGQVLAVE